ncbi:MAG TPA: HypC/HybG/HupF family hydrogenase formation chaperone [Candidatus Gemmiger excrementipullorum]|uniref:HypC/HybG/HupF family hydrogenase formation chaperone n=1 Tax=Candidatus Gemmiger excrementipullorum TaxID=2838610 RepID=A0A9D1Y1V1_9FIRM|nr:HypC/HybG/HupF family hydrogenase formation chaperone [Candidatus Gemmiger excrementipullorum]
MCLAVPLKIVSVDGKRAVGEAGGLTQTLRVDFLPDIQPGDYVMVHAGFAIERLSEQQARENLACIEEALDAR